MDEVTIQCKVTAVHPAFDQIGNEYVCVEFAVETKPVSFTAMPTSAPPEAQAIMPILSQIPKMFSQGKVYSNRLVLYFTPEEWEHLTRRYAYGEEYEVKVDKNGVIQVTPI
jgi:hypothetical protein